MSMQEDGRLQVLFLRIFEIKGYKCFVDHQMLKLSNSQGEHAKWTIILGNNGTGKTSLLEAIELLYPIKNSANLQPQNDNLDGPESSTSPAWIRHAKMQRTPANAALYLSLGKGQKPLPPESWNGHTWVSPLKDQPKHMLSIVSIEGKIDEIDSAKINAAISYWATRKMGRSVDVTENEYIPTHLRELINAEEWLAQLDYAILRDVPGIKKQWKTITDALIEILPDVQGFRPATTKDFKHYIEVETDYGWVPLRQLSYGYQTMLAWIVDLAKRMIDAYPDSDTPLKESAVVLVDEIDLHLHPSWQRRIVGDLSRIFPNVQFIATSHSPLVVQSAERCNIAVLHKDGDRVHIRNYPDQSYQGWSVEEILRDLMEMDSTHSEAFTLALKAFEQAIGADDYAAANAAYQTLDRILHPESVHRKLMRMQMSGLERPAQV